MRVREDCSPFDTASTTGAFYEPFPSSVAVPGFGTDVPRRGQNLTTGWTKPFGARIVNEARFAYSRVAIGVFQENQGRSINQEVGLPELSSNPRDFGLSQITVVGFSPLGDEFTTPQESKTDMFQILDTVSWATGSHLVKTGFDFRNIRPGRLSRRLVARAPEFLRSLHHRQRPCGSPAGISVRYKRRHTRQSTEAALDRRGAVSFRTAGGCEITLR